MGDEESIFYWSKSNFDNDLATSSTYVRGFFGSSPFVFCVVLVGDYVTSSRIEDVGDGLTTGSEVETVDSAWIELECPESDVLPQLFPQQSKLVALRSEFL